LLLLLCVVRSQLLTPLNMKGSDGEFVREMYDVVSLDVGEKNFIRNCQIWLAIAVRVVSNSFFVSFFTDFTEK